MRSVLACAAVLLNLAAPAIAAAAQDKATSLTLYTTDFLGFMGGDAPRPGVLVEMVQLAAARTGYTIRQMELPWPRAMMLARTEQVGLIAGLTRLPAREANYTWIVRQMAIESVFISLGRRVDSFAQAKQLSAIGVHRGTSYEVELEERGFENIRSFSNTEQLVKLFEHNRVDAWFGAAHEISSRFRTLDPIKRRSVVVGTPVMSEEIWLAGPKTLPPQIVEDFSYGTRLIIDEGHRERLMRKYFGGS